MSQNLLDYFGREHMESRSIPSLCWRLLCNLVVLVILVIVVAVRAALLLGGLICVFAGTLLLMLSGQRDAAKRIARWRARGGELLRLWIDDILRPLRRPREHREPLPVLPA
jgi:hypothetical protein